MFVTPVVHSRFRRERLKVKLVSSRSWQIAFGDDVARWERPREFMPGWTIALEIVIPNTEVVRPTPQIDVTAADVQWMPLYETDGDTATGLRILFSSADIPSSSQDWPGNDGSGDAELLARARLANGETVWFIRAKGEISEDLRAELDQNRLNNTDESLPQRSSAMQKQLSGEHSSIAGANTQPTYSRRTVATCSRIPLNYFVTSLTANSCPFLGDVGPSPGKMDGTTLAVRLTALLEDVFGRAWLQRAYTQHTDTVLANPNRR